tara:strand:+ start:387 stop:653 length:267 start_codon:yes stop_codon:yes gene_type:complete
MFSSSSLSSLSSLNVEEAFSPRHIEMMRAIDALWALQSVEGAKASAAYIASFSELQRRKMRNALREQVELTNRFDHRRSLQVLIVGLL